MTAQPNQGFIFAAPHPDPPPTLRPVDVAIHTVAVFRAGGGADPETTCRPSRTNAAAGIRVVEMPENSARR